MLEKLMEIIDKEVVNSLEEYRKMKLNMVGTNPKGRSRQTEKEIPDYLHAGILTAMQMKLQAIELRKKAEELDKEANDTLMPNMIVAAVKTITLDNIGQVTYREGRKNSSKWPEADLKAEALIMGFKAEDIRQAWPEKVDPKEKLMELGYGEKRVKELWKAVEVVPKQEKGDPTIAFTPWKTYQEKVSKINAKKN